MGVINISYTIQCFMSTTAIVLFLIYSVFYSILGLQLQIASSSKLHELSEIERRVWRGATTQARIVCSLPMIGRFNGIAFLMCIAIRFDWWDAAFLFGGSFVAGLLVGVLRRSTSTSHSLTINLFDSLLPTLAIFLMPAFAVAAWVAFCTS